MKSYTFRIIIEPDEKGTFHGYVPALPGCHTWGKSIEDARKNVREAMELYLEEMTHRKSNIPQESGFETFETVLINKK